MMSVLGLRKIRHKRDLVTPITDATLPTCQLSVEDQFVKEG